MKNINTIIFSMNRAAQLDLLLQSIKRYAAWQWPPEVITRATEPDFAAAYRQLSREHGIGLTWEYNGSFKSLIVAAIDPHLPLTAFLVDDSVYYRECPPVSLRVGEVFAPHLGKNCTHCYPLNRPQKEGELDFTESRIIDGHIFCTDDILHNARTRQYGDPNRFEEAMREGPPLKILYAEHSSAVTIPANIVQTNNPHNRNAGGSVEELNRRYVDGERLDLDAMDFSDVRGFHQEIPFVWRKR